MCVSYQSAGFLISSFFCLALDHGWRCNGNNTSCWGKASGAEWQTKWYNVLKLWALNGSPNEANRFLLLTEEIQRHLCISTPQKPSRIEGKVIISDTLNTLYQGTSSMMYAETSRHQSAREETEEQKKLKNCYVLFSRISSRQAAGFEKDKTLNMQECRPDRSAMQRHCSLRLFCKKTDLQYSTVHGLWY